MSFYQRATRQGASGYIAGIYERYVFACEDASVKPMPCKSFLASVDYQSVEDTISQNHSTVAAVLIRKSLQTR